MTKTEPEFWAVVPVLATNDVVGTAAYYRDVLGFVVDDTFSAPEWTMLWADQCQLFLSLNPAAAQTAKGQQVLICVPGVDEMYERHKANGATIISDIENKPWGLREYTVEDPSGYHLWFEAHIETQYLPWKAKREAKDQDSD